MALIKCPECGKEISDKAKACIHCGFPLDEKVDTVVVPPKKQKTVASYMCNECLEMYTLEHKEGSKTQHCPVCGQAMELWAIEQINDKTGLVDKRITPKSNLEQNLPRCPTCQSTKIHKISKLSKAGDAIFWGVFAIGKVNKQWHCDNCGSEW